jgi:Trk K+ transport system NAD-binding subunit
MCKPWAPDPLTPLHVDLLGLLRSGVAVSLAQGKQLTLGILRKKSPWVDKPLRLGYLAERSGETTLLAILREGQIIVPHRETILRAGDRLLMITSSESQERLKPHLAALSAERASE